MKKKLLAGLLSFTVLTAQMLPVIAADDADVVVSENAVVVEETEEEAGQEAEAEPQVVEEAVDDVEIELGEDDEEIVLGEGEEIRYEVATAEDLKTLLNGEDVVIDEDAIDEAGAFIKIGNRTTASIVADPVEIAGTTYNLDIKLSYYGAISYRGRKIKAVDDAKDSLNAQASSASLEKLAMDLTGASNAAGLITWKYSAKKNTNANSGSYFTVQAKVNKTVAKSIGLKGKALKNFNKGLKKVNKAAKAKENRQYFTITPISTDDMQLGADWVPIVTIYTRWGIEVSRKFSHIRIRTENSMPADPNNNGWKKWKKISNKEFTKTTETIEGQKYIVLTPKAKNITGGAIGVRK